LEQESRCVGKVRLIQPLFRDRPTQMRTR
jgi:hypothetical protein